MIPAGVRIFVCTEPRPTGTAEVVRSDLPRPS